CRPDQLISQCTEPPRTGPCRASHTRWYYNPLYKTCYTFTYGGCDGNGNNFEESQKCSETCEGVTGIQYTHQILYNMIPCSIK
uniref:BPTI/Kunitz inhibitor domain-containing protein n=1 Tax=Acanthochromis polyacanthus TaxID=80966 RepID=A0A3Q1G8C7_9TELE